MASSSSSSTSSSTSKEMTQLDVLMALQPESAMDYDLHNGGLTFGGRRVFIRETGKLEYPYGDSTFVAALMTAKCMEYTYTKKLRGARVLELGAGTGALGLVAAALGARRVLLSDLPCSIAQLKNNVALNETHWTKSSSDDDEENDYVKGTLEVCELDWFKPGDVAALGEFDFIVGSELMFDEDLLGPLANVLVTLTDLNPKAIVLLGYQDRMLVDDDDIEEAFGPHFEYERVRSEEMHPEFRVRVCEALRIYRLRRRKRTSGEERVAEKVDEAL